MLSTRRNLDKWVRRKLRCHLGNTWGRAGQRERRKRCVGPGEAWNVGKSAHGPWRASQQSAPSIALPMRCFEQVGLPSQTPRQEFNSTNRRIRDAFVRWRGRLRGVLLCRSGVLKAGKQWPSSEAKKSPSSFA